MLVSYLAAILLCAAQLTFPPSAVDAALAQEPTKEELEITGLSERLVRSVVGLDPASRQLWLELSKKDPAHASLAETLPALPKIPFSSGAMIPTDLVFGEGLPGHLSLPTAKGIRVLMENEAEAQVDLSPSGISAATKWKTGKEIITWSDDVLGIKWSATNPQILKLSDVRKAFGVSGPTMDRYHDAVYWLPDDHVSFAGEVWSYSAKVKRADYIRGDSDWGDVFFDSQPSPGCRNNLRTRMAPGGGLYHALAFCPRNSNPHIALVWMRKSNLRGRYLTPLEVLRQESATIPFEFVPWGKPRQPLLCIVSKNRVPVLMRLSADGAEEVVKGEPVPVGFKIVAA
jgi:hypothetical protein